MWANKGRKDSQHIERDVGGKRVDEKRGNELEFRPLLFGARPWRLMEPFDQQKGMQFLTIFLSYFFGIIRTTSDFTDTGRGYKHLHQETQGQKVNIGPTVLPRLLFQRTVVTF